MKFVALALALLLAVGSQAAPMMADAPTQLQHARAALDVYLTQLITGIKNTVAAAENPELTSKVSMYVDAFQTQIKALQAQVAPMTDSVVSTIVDATADFRAGIRSDIDTLKVQLEPQREELRKVLEKHVEEYRTLLEPVIQEYQEQQNKQVMELTAKLEPLREELKAKIETNVEETKAALDPIVEAVHAKLSERVDALKEMLSPYVEEYREQLKRAVTEARGFSAADVTSLREKITPLGEEIIAKLREIAQTIIVSINQE